MYSRKSEKIHIRALMSIKGFEQALKKSDQNATAR
jgi:hypothetical protein